jgi:hypothetical protein
MVLVVVGHRGANTTLERMDCDQGRWLKTHATTRPTASPEDVEGFRRSPQTHLRFGFASMAEARVRGLGNLT